MVSWLQNCLRLSWTTSSAWKCSKFYRLVLVLPTDSVYPEISSSSVHFKYHIHCSRPSRHHLIETILYELATLSDVTDKLEDVAITWQPNGPRRAHRSGSHCTEVHGVQLVARFLGLRYGWGRPLETLPSPWWLTCQIWQFCIKHCECEL